MWSSTLTQINTFSQNLSWWHYHRLVSRLSFLVINACTFDGNITLCVNCNKTLTSHKLNRFVFFVSCAISMLFLWYSVLKACIYSPFTHTRSGKQLGYKPQCSCNVFLWLCKHTQTMKNKQKQLVCKCITFFHKNFISLNSSHKLKTDNWF